MSRFSLSSSLGLFQSVSGSDSDATNSSSSSNSAINNSSSSLSPSTVQCQLSTSRNDNIAQSLFDQRFNDSFKFNSSNKSQHQPNISNHLLELQREIKEEEEEIFALINDRTNLYTSFDDDADIQDHTEGLSDVTTTTITNTSCQASTGANDCKTRAEQVYNSDYFQLDEEESFKRHDLFSKDDHSKIGHYSGNTEKCPESINNNTLSGLDRYDQGQDFVICNRVAGQQPILEQLSEHEQQEEHYFNTGHEDDTKEHLTEEQIRQEEDSAQQQHHLDEYQRDLQQLTNNLPKPCVFFLEGNCRRSDCKYSHDLSSITCKYWIEGFCFKGELCPFLHSFNQKGQISNLLDDDIALAKKKLNPTFAIESEADFPSLPLDAPNVTLSVNLNAEIDSDGLSRKIENQILSSNPAVVFKTTKKKRKKG